MRGHVTGTSHSDSYPLLWMIEGRSVLAKSNRTTWHFEWILRLEKFSENALKASSWRNRTLEGEGSEDEEAPERRGFWVGVDLRLGAIDTTNVNRFRGRRREEQSEKSQAIQLYQIYEKKSTYAWEMYEHVTWETNCSWAQPNPNLSTHRQVAYI